MCGHCCSPLSWQWCILRHAPFWQTQKIHISSRCLAGSLCFALVQVRKTRHSRTGNWRFCSKKRRRRCMSTSRCWFGARDKRFRPEVGAGRTRGSPRVLTCHFLSTLHGVASRKLIFYNRTRIALRYLCSGEGLLDYYRRLLLEIVEICDLKRFCMRS